MGVERTASGSVRWHWLRFDRAEQRSALFCSFEQCLADARTHGFDFSCAYHVLAEHDVAPPSCH